MIFSLLLFEQFLFFFVNVLLVWIMRPLDTNWKDWSVITTVIFLDCNFFLLLLFWCSYDCCLCYKKQENVNFEKNTVLWTSEWSYFDRCLPLMALINYRGFRLVAISLLPINKSTIIYGRNFVSILCDSWMYFFLKLIFFDFLYLCFFWLKGSCDGGVTAHNSNETFNRKMEEAAKILNLKGHIVGLDKKAMIYSAGDIEGFSFLFFFQTFPKPIFPFFFLFFSYFIHVLCHFTLFVQLIDCLLVCSFVSLFIQKVILDLMAVFIYWISRASSLHNLKWERTGTVPKDSQILEIVIFPSHSQKNKTRTCNCCDILF